MSQQTVRRYLASLLRIRSQPAQELPIHLNKEDRAIRQGPNSNDDAVHKEPIGCEAEKQGVYAVTGQHSRYLVARMPTHGDRYRRKRTPPNSENCDQVIFSSGPRPIQTTHDIAQGWDEDVHPDGQLLYSTVVPSGDLKIRVHTDLALRVKRNHSIISSALDLLLNLLDTCSNLHTSGLRSSEIEACILVREASPNEFGYYLANHRDQTVFWLEDVNPDSLDMSYFDADIYQHRLTAQYWRHVTDFPHHCSLPQKVCDQLGPLMLLGAVDQEYCEESTAPRDAQTLARLEAFWRQTKEERDADCNKAACNWICARLWFDLISPRVCNYWGTDYARLEQTTVVGDDVQPSQNPVPWLVRLACFVFLWNEPAATMKILDNAWPGGVIYSRNWAEMTESFSNEWERTSLLSVVTFIGSTIFLALPLSTLQGNLDAEDAQDLPIMIASFCGIACCVLSGASLFGAVTLKRAFQGKITKDVHEAVAYIQSLHSDTLGYLKWGILFSLPRVLLRWAFVLFCGGLIEFAFELHSNHLEFFYAEIALVGILFVMTLTSRRLLPRSY